MLIFTRIIVVVALTISNLLAYANEVMPLEKTISAGIANRQQGKLQLSIDQLAEARKTASSDQDRMRIAGELGATLLQARRLDQAGVSLREAYLFFSGSERARYALSLGNLAVIRKHQKDAQRYYEEALKLADSNADIHASAGLNLVRLAPEPERLEKLTALFQEIGKLEDPTSRARFYLNLGDQARKLGKPALALAYRSLDKSRQLLTYKESPRLYAETLNALAQLYEDRGRNEDALTLTQQAISQAHALASNTIGDLLISLEWRSGRLQKILNKQELALAAYQRAVDQIEILRQDIPIDYDDGRSSFSSTLAPIYLGLADLLLQEAEGQSGDRLATSLRRVRDIVDLIKQSEMQDYLGDRCSVETIKGGSETVIAAGTAILYPIIFNDRIELLLETNAGIVRYTTKIPGPIVRQAAARLADDLRNRSDGYLMNAQQLYDWIFRPFASFAADRHIDTLVIVPDGALRLVAMGALHDGKQFAIEKFAITSVTSLSMTNTDLPPTSTAVALIAGASEFGAVVEKLNQASIGSIFGKDNSKDDAATRKLAKNRNLRSIRNFAIKSTNADTVAQVSRTEELRKSLALPGVADEIQSVSRILPGATMLNAAFTANEFRRNAESGAYHIVHIATHGVFGGSSNTSFILAYDDLLTMDGLQSMLKSDKFLKNPIELLTLSACETAEGDDRSPLGISGAAIKARAKSVLGTLWPVEDDAAKKVMEKFYGGLTAEHLSKAEALRRAQVELIHLDEFANPSSWAPFVLIGNWL